MPRDIDALTSPTLKHLRDRWWDSTFTTFLENALHPLAGKRMLDVGCGTGVAELSLGALQLPQLRLFAVDIALERVREARAASQDHFARARFTVGDARSLPFASGWFDCAFCVAVLQHLKDPAGALREFARVTRPGGRVLTVEPDNSTRFWYSSLDSGRRAFDVAARFFEAVTRERADVADAALGPKLPGLFRAEGLEPLAVQLFPVSVSRLGAAPAAVWEARLAEVRAAVDRAPSESIRRLGRDLVRAVELYAAEAAAVGPAFVEIQNTMLFATVGQKRDE